MGKTGTATRKCLLAAGYVLLPHPTNRSVSTGKPKLQDGLRRLTPKGALALLLPAGHNLDWEPGVRCAAAGRCAPRPTESY